MANTSERIAGNVLLLAVARVSMALAMPTLGLLFWLYTGWQMDKLSTLQGQIEKSQHSADEASKLAVKLSERLVSVETTRPLRFAGAGFLRLSGFIPPWNLHQVPRQARHKHLTSIPEVTASLRLTILAAATHGQRPPCLACAAQNASSQAPQVLLRSP
jgi:hypothetical protein